jgi:hypothetical protein
MHSLYEGGRRTVLLTGRCGYRVPEEVLGVLLSDVTPNLSYQN